MLLIAGTGRVLRSLLSEPEVRATLHHKFVCSWVLKDDLARDLQIARAGAGGRERQSSGEQVHQEATPLMARLAASIAQASPELAQVVVVSPLAWGSFQVLGTYAETGRDAAFDRVRRCEGGTKAVIAVLYSCM